MNDLLRSSAAHVFVNDIESPVLSEDDVHHLRNVLRLRADEVVSVSDGSGSWRLSVLDRSGLRATTEVHTESQSPRRLSVAIVPVKGDRTESAVEKLVEVGVDEIVVMRPTQRSVVRWDDAKSAAHLDRLRRIARSAAMQCRRVFLPVVTGPVAFDDIVATPGVAVADPSGGQVGGEVHTIVIGPEGGFSESEIAAARATVCLGPHVLRADTAAVVAGVLMVTLMPRASDNTV